MRSVSIRTTPPVPAVTHPAMPGVPRRMASISSPTKTIVETVNGQTDGRAQARPPVKSAPGKPVAVWSCAQAKTAVERLICANPDLRAQDTRMGALYAEAQARGQSPERMQSDWLINQRNACESADCLRDVYADRIRHFETRVGAEAVAGQAVDQPFPGAPPVTSPPSRPEMAITPLLPATAPASATTAATAPNPEPTPSTLRTYSQTGIPALPQPETSDPSPARPPQQPDTPSPSSIKREALVLVVAVALVIVGGRYAWRIRSRIGTALASSRRRLARATERLRAVSGARSAQLKRRHAQARPRTSVPASEASPATGWRTDELRLSDDTLDRLRALALPGESLSSVIARAVAALEPASDHPPTTAVLSRLQALETRLEHLEGEGSVAQAGDNG